MMNPSSTTSGFKLEFEEKSNSIKVQEEKKISGFNKKISLISSGLDHISDNNVRNYDENMMNNQTGYMKEGKDEMFVMNPLLSQRSYIDFMQNCDLPPPLKVFSVADKTVLTSIKTQPYTKICGEDEFPNTKDMPEVEKLDLLRALQLSQTRAREAEKKVKVITKERDNLSDSFLKESLRILAYKHWVKLLEFEVSQLQYLQNENNEQTGCKLDRERESSSSSEEDEEKLIEEDVIGSFTWYMALALCFGIAGVGFVFGCRYYSMF